MRGRCGKILRNAIGEELVVNTNQMDILAFRTQKENILKAYRAFWTMHLGVILEDNGSACYVTQEIANEYRHPREDNLFG